MNNESWQVILGIDRSEFIKKFVNIFGAVNYLDLQDYVLSNVPSSFILYEQKVSSKKV